ncbi:dentin sialophosphoprotein isoform X2 [Capsella rubella]|uniref:dentin sialophosphoprotein isoform X2 n=1 Tax=Capsella rubella TaxID=81985 RepID=UPI000CD4CA13|nr:dentin sialophosphoprotein isoform X2 [Capsella rubella]
MEEQREESEFFNESMEEEAGRTETLVGEDTNTVQVSDSGISGIDADPNNGVLATEDGNTDNLVSDEEQMKADDVEVNGEETRDNADDADVVEVSGEELRDNVDDDVEVSGEEPKDNVDDEVSLTDANTDLEVERNGETATSEVKTNHGESHESVTSGGNEVSDEKTNCEVEDTGEDTKDNVVDDDDVALTDAAIEEPGIGRKGEMANSEVKSNHGESHESAGEGESVISGGIEISDEKVNCEVEDIAGKKASQEKESTKNIEDDDKRMGDDGEQEKLCHSYDEECNLGCETSGADQEKESAKKSDVNNNNMDVDSKHGHEENVGSETKDATVLEESIQLSEKETNEVNPVTVLEVSSAAEMNENGEAMEVDNATEEQVEDDVKDIPVAEADVNTSNVREEMEIDERKDNADAASDLTGTIVSTDLANPNSPSENADPGEVEPLDHHALFDPTSDITNFIDFSGVSSWSGNIQDIKTDTSNISSKENKKAADMAEEVASVGIENGSSEARVASGAKSPADAILGSEENQESKDHECLDQKVTMRMEEDITHEAQSVDPNQNEDTEMEKDPNNSIVTGTEASEFEEMGDTYWTDEAGSDIKTNGVKRKADVLSEDSPGEGRKTVSLAKVSFAQRPSFKIGACIARVASQMAESPSVLKGSNFDGETLSVESFVSQLHCAATDPDKENVVSDIAAGFFLDFRNSSALQQGTPEKVSKKRARLSSSNATGTEAFEFEEMGDTYWTDRVIHNGGEEQTSPTEKGKYQIVPVELKPTQVQRTRRPYRRRQTQINIPLSVSEKPPNFDENAPAELVMKFCEEDTIPTEKTLSKMFRHFGPIKESQTEVDKENNRARVVYRKGADAEVAYNSAGRFSVFGTKAVNYELSYTITETFKVRPYVVSLGEEDATLCLPSSM